MPGSPQSDDPLPSERFGPTAPDSRSAHSDLTDNLQGRANLSTNLEERELEAALQLLVERAQYITGATGTALALPQGDEMVCRASAGACAPTVGARLQVRSGLTGESIARRQLLRCDNAESDPRVNLETCRALGIASIVVLPLLRRTGEVRGLFELFSDHPYAFEERDLVALERMAALTLTALDLAEQQHDSVAPAPAALPVKQTKGAGQVANPAPRTTYSPKETSTELSRSPGVPAEVHADTRISPVLSEAVRVPPLSRPAETEPAAAAGESSKMGLSAAIEGVQGGAEPVVSAPVLSAPVSAPVVSVQMSSPPVSSTQVVSSPVVEDLPPELAPVPEAMLRVRKCSACGFPISEGRTVCLDCESMERVKIESEKKAREKAAREVREIEPTKNSAGAVPKAAETKSEESKQEENSENESKEDVSASASAPAEDGILPAFLTNPQLVEEPWLARHVSLLVFLVLVASVLVAAVVFFR